MTPADDAAPVRSLDKDALKAKYRAERDKRLLRECKGKANAGACEGYAS